MTWFLCLYPPAWRARYGEEMHAMLAGRAPDAADAWDLVCGAIDAWIIGPRGVSLRRPDTWVRAVAMSAVSLIVFTERQVAPASPGARTLSLIAVALVVGWAVVMRHFAYSREAVC